MDKIELYNAICKRKSIRKYDMTPLPAETLTEISEYISSLQPKDNTIQTEMRMVAEKDVSSLLPIKAPHYVVAFSENKEGYLSNIGFMLQQLDLFLAVKRLGSCWQGIPRPTKEIVKGSQLEFVIVMSFGKPNEPLYRENVGQFKRKALDQIRSFSTMDELLEPVRLAPSATNSQPWFFTGSGNRIHAYCIKTNFFKALIYKKMNQVDMGIALYHLWLAAQVKGTPAVFVDDEAARDHPPDGYYYIASMDIQQ